MPSLARPTSMTDVPVAPRGRGRRYNFALIVLAASCVVGWPGFFVSVSVVLADAVYGLLSERERRKTLQVICSHAPRGTVLVQGEGPGPALLVQVGHEGQGARGSARLPHARHAACRQEAPCPRRGRS